MLGINGLNADLPGKEALQPQKPTAPYADPSTTPNYQKSVVAFVKDFVAGGQSGSSLPVNIFLRFKYR
jgi:hypothetical protein